MVRIVSVSDDTRPVSSKTFQDFEFFFKVNQAVTIAFSSCLLHEQQAATTSRSCKIKRWRKRTDSFSPYHICVSSGFRNLNLPFLEGK